MTDLAFATIFTGAVILIWGFRALRNQSVNVLFFKMRSRWSTWIFGFVSVLCGLLMLLSGLAATSSLSAELVEIMARSGLYGFATGWILSLVLEAIDRINWRIFPDAAPVSLRAKQKLMLLSKSQRKQKSSDLDQLDRDSPAAEPISGSSDR